MISLLILIPIIGSIIILLVPNNNLSLVSDSGSSESNSNTDSSSSLFNTNDGGNKNISSITTMKEIALTTAIINFFISLFLWYQFDSTITEYQFISEFLPSNIININGSELSSMFHFYFGVDGISLYFIILTTFVSPVALLSNYKNVNNNIKLFLISILLLESLQICAFAALDLLLFYIFFESVLPILFVITIVFGHGDDRIRSSFLLFLYTLAGSLPMLLSILSIYNFVGNTDFQYISLNSISFEYQKLLWVGFFIAFAFKTPLYPFVIWLPKAHADSVLAGSIILAATVLKLAVYGELRILVNFLPDATNYFSPLVQTIAVISIIYASFSTIVQQDTKRIIAYSSIAHMGVITLGVFSNSIQGIEGAILLSVAHGFVSPALFICVGGVILDRTGTRNILYIRGLASMMPVFVILFFMFTLANAGVPLSLNWLGEIMSLIGIWTRTPLFAILGSTGIVLSACYSLFLYNRLSYGSYSPHLSIYKDLNRREYYLLLSLLVPTFLLGIFPNLLLDTLHVSITSLIYNV